MTLKKRSQKQEKSVAKTLKGRTTIASGAFFIQKADVRTDKFLVECKTTAKNYYTITFSLWHKIEQEATRDRMRIPLFVIDLEDRNRYYVFNSLHFDSREFLSKDYTKENTKRFKIQPDLFKPNIDGINFWLQDFKKYNLCCMPEYEFLTLLGDIERKQDEL